MSLYYTDIAVCILFFLRYVIRSLLTQKYSDYFVSWFLCTYIGVYKADIRYWCTFQSSV